MRHDTNGTATPFCCKVILIIARLSRFDALIPVDLVFMDLLLRGLKLKNHSIQRNAFNHYRQIRYLR